MRWNTAQSSLTDRIIFHTYNMALEISPSIRDIVCDLCVSDGQQSSGQWPGHPAEKAVPAVESIISTDQTPAHWLDGEVSACRAGDTGEPFAGKIPWRRARQPTPVFLPGESHGQRSLEGYSPQGHKESDMTKATERACIHIFIHPHTQTHSHWIKQLTLNHRISYMRKQRNC